MTTWFIGGDYDNWKTTPPPERDPDWYCEACEQPIWWEEHRQKYCNECLAENDEDGE